MGARRSLSELRCPTARPAPPTKDIPAPCPEYQTAAAMRKPVWSPTTRESKAPRPQRGQPRIRPRGESQLALECLLQPCCPSLSKPNRNPVLPNHANRRQQDQQKSQYHG